MLTRRQAIKAFVVLAPGYAPSDTLKKALKRACNAHISSYKWIRHIEFVGELPKTISGKIKKRVLREQPAL